MNPIEWIRKRLNKPIEDESFDTGLISDEWFRSHFDFAAREVCNELRGAINLDGAELIDFGCGDGITALGVATQGNPARLVGVDITQGFSQIENLAKQQLGMERLPKALEYHQVEAGKPLDYAGMDAIYSWSVFEHVDRAHLPEILGNMLHVLRPGGVAFIQIEPLYYSAFGSHLQRLVPEPWAHLLMEPAELEERVLSYSGGLSEEDRDLAAADGVTPRFKEWLYGEYRTLNRLTGDELVVLVRDAGFEIEREHRGERPETPPESLLQNHSLSDLRTNEIRLLARKPA